jgi:predicted permease
MSVPRRRHLAEAAFSLALLAYPRTFRRRFGDEMRDDFRRGALGGAVGTCRTFLTLLGNGLAERGTAVVRWLFWPSHAPHLYDSSTGHAMVWDNLRTDLRFALRQARRAPLATALAVAALALGVGANTAVFTVIDAVLLRPLPYQAPDSLVMVWSDNRNEGRALNVVSPADYADFRARTRALSATAYTLSFFTPLVEKGAEDAGRVVVLRTSDTVFELLGRQAALGRTYGAGERGVAVISHALWVGRFGADPSVVGRTLTFSGDETLTVIGVMPPDFAFPYRSMFGPWASSPMQSAELWVPMPMEGPRWVTPGGQLVRNLRALVVFGRLRENTSLGQARADLAAAATQLEREYPDSNRGWGVTVVPLHEQTTGQVRPALLVLLAGSGVLLLIAVANVANLVLARSLARQRELTVRAALGASTARLVQQALTESMALAVAGAGLAGVVVVWGLGGLVALAPPELPRLSEIRVDWRMLAATTGIAMLAGLLVGLVPAIAASIPRPQTALHNSARNETGTRATRRWRAGLVMAEMGLTVVLLVAAGLLTRSFARLLAVDPGFSSDAVLTLQVNAPDRFLASPAARSAFYEALLERLTAIPGVTAAGLTTRIPLGSTSVTTSVEVEGQSVAVAQRPEAEFRRASPAYFAAMGIPVLRGRPLSEDDTAGPPAAVVNEAFVRRILGPGDPLERHVRTGGGTSGPWIRIIGVVGDVHHLDLETEPLPEIYLHYATSPPVSPFVAVRTTGDPAALASTLRLQMRAFEPSMPVYDMRTTASLRSQSMSDRRFVLGLAVLYGALALALAAIGVYGVIALVVEQRTREVGVRLALGARPRDVLWMVIRESAALASAAALAGTLAARALTPLLRGQLYSVDAGDLFTHASAPVVLVGAAVLAALVPARRAMRVDPVAALRAE